MDVSISRLRKKKFKYRRLMNDSILHSTIVRNIIRNNIDRNIN